MTNFMKRWIAAATPTELQRLANYARTTVGHLRQIAGGYRTDGHPSVTADLAGRIEHGAARLRARNPSLPVVSRTHLCPACKVCPFAANLTKK